MPYATFPITECTDTNVGDVNPLNVVAAFPTPGRATTISGLPWSNTRLLSSWQAPANASVASNASQSPFGVNRTGFALRIAMALVRDLRRLQRAVRVEAPRIQPHRLDDLLLVALHDQVRAQHCLALSRNDS